MRKKTSLELKESEKSNEELKNNLINEYMYKVRTGLYESDDPIEDIRVFKKYIDEIFYNDPWYSDTIEEITENINIENL